MDLEEETLRRAAENAAREEAEGARVIGAVLCPAPVHSTSGRHAHAPELVESRAPLSARLKRLLWRARWVPCSACGAVV